MDITSHKFYKDSKLLKKLLKFLLYKFKNILNYIYVNI